MSQQESAHTRSVKPKWSTKKKVTYAVIVILFNPLMICFFWGSLYESQKKERPQAETREQKKEWYEGGGLNKTNAQEWLDANYERKLATSADWVASTPHGKKQIKDGGGVDALHGASTLLVDCINKAATALKEDERKSKDTAELAVSCLAQWKYL